MYVANVAEDGFNGQSVRSTPCSSAPTTEGAEVVPVCAAIEAEIAAARRGRPRRPSSRTSASHEPGLDRVIRAAYQLLGLQTFFTAGPKEVRAWTVHAGATAPQAAGVIHTDFERGFIRAEVIALRRLHRLQGRAGREGGRQAAARGQGVRRARRRRHALPVQRLRRARRRTRRPPRRTRVDVPAPPPENSRPPATPVESGTACRPASW